MYFIYLFILLISVYLAPALALFPTLIYKPHTMISMPVLSSLLIVILVSMLLAMHVFTHSVVLGITGGIVALAIYRVYKAGQLVSLGFSFKSSQLYLFNLLLMLPFFVKLGTHSFDQGDEIYSWNYWAIQHYLQLPPDFTHTGAPYPQFFPKLLAYQYQLIGNIDYQLPIKALLGLFSFTLLNTFATAARPYFRNKNLKYGVLILWIVFGIGLQHFFNDGYADPIMCSSLVLSVYYAWLATQFKNKRSIFWWLALATGWVAAYAKQPGLLWLGLILPICFLYFNNKALFQYKFKTGLFLFASTGASLLWMVTEGKQFQANGGVIGASLQNRNLSDHLSYLLNHYFIQQPFLGVFFILALLGFVHYFRSKSLNKSKQKKIILALLVVLILPYLILWFTFGAYQLRLGQHVIALMGLAVILSNYQGLFLYNKFIGLISKKIKIPLPNRYGYLGLIGLSIFGSLFLALKQERYKMPGIAWQAAGQRTLQVYFLKDGHKVYEETYQKPDKKIWVPTQYLYGIFYGHTPVVMVSGKSVLENILLEKPNYVMTASTEITAENWANQLNQMIAQCPDAFNKITTQANRYNLGVYQLNYQNLVACIS